MRTSAQIKTEIKEKFGFVPPFFEPVEPNPYLFENLWQQTLTSYVNNPLSPLFKEKLSAYLSRYCAVPYCMICHSCSLRPLGMTAREVLQLLDSPPPTVTDIEKYLSILVAANEVPLSLPPPKSELEESLLYCAIFIAVETEQSEHCRQELRRILGEVNYQYLSAFIVYTKICHVWMESYPEVVYEADQRVIDNLGDLVAEEPALGEFFSNYRERVKLERQSRAEKLARIAERRRNEAALQQSEERLRLALEAARMRSWDWNLLTGMGADSDTNQPFIACLYPEKRESISQAVNHALKAGTSYEIEFQLVLPDGSIQWTVSKGRVFQEQPGIAVRMAGVDMDITERKQVEEHIRNLNIELEKRVEERTEELLRSNAQLHDEVRERKRIEEERARLLIQEQQARKEAEVASRMKDEFLAIVSHELRTPLNAIQGWAQMLRCRTFDTTTTNNALETIERNARAQAQLIDDILDVSRIIRGKLRLQVCPVNLASVIKAAVEAVRPAAEAKSINIQSSVNSSIGRVLGAPDRLQQIIWNLLSNAVKFTPSHGVVEVQLGGNSTHAQIKVTDTGQGISTEFLPYVFDRFRQADSSMTRPHGGLGLGLAIARHLVELHGGTISVTSQGQGQGATFTVDLPLTATHLKKNDSGWVLPKSSDRPPIFNKVSPSLNGLQILVVDDDTDTCELIMTMLEEYGAKVTAVGSAAEALDTLLIVKPDVLVSDIGMPDENGYTFIRKVRSLEGDLGGPIPAIALTAYAREEDRTQALNAGFQVHMTKPVDTNQLVTAVAQLAGYSNNGCRV